MALKTGIVKGEIFLKHIPGDGCPDTPKRLEDLYSMLNDPDMQDHFVDVLPQKAKKEEILLFHTPEYFEKVAEAEPNWPGSYYSLGGIYYKLGQIELAIKTTEKAMNLAETAGEKAQAEKFRKQLQLYKTGKSYNKR